MSEYDYSDYRSQIASIEQANAQTINRFFSNSATSQQGIGSNSLAFNYSDYSLIQSGAYSKLLKAYYDKVENGSSTDGSVDKNSAEYKSVVLAKNDAKQLKSALVDLSETDVYNKTDKGEYNRDNIYKLASDFVKNYNNVIEDADKIDSIAVLTGISRMTGITSANQNLLNSVGIKIGEGNKLEIDETKFKKADINELKTLFTGNGSYAGRIAYKASNIENLAANITQTQGNGGSRMYTSSAQIYNAQTGSLFNQVF